VSAVRKKEANKKLETTLGQEIVRVGPFAFLEEPLAPDASPIETRPVEVPASHGPVPYQRTRVTWSMHYQLTDLSNPVLFTIKQAVRHALRHRPIVEKGSSRLQARIDLTHYREANR
jgi:hypothetical protein